MNHERFGDLRSLLHGSPGHGALDQICAQTIEVAANTGDREALDAWIRYAGEALRSWPQHVVCTPFTLGFCHLEPLVRREIANEAAHQRFLARATFEALAPPLVGDRWSALGPHQVSLLARLLYQRTTDSQWRRFGSPEMYDNPFDEHHDQALYRRVHEALRYGDYVERFDSELAAAVALEAAVAEYLEQIAGPAWNLWCSRAHYDMFDGFEIGLNAVAMWSALQTYQRLWRGRGAAGFSTAPVEVGLATSLLEAHPPAPGTTHVEAKLSDVITAIDEELAMLWTRADEEDPRAGLVGLEAALPGSFDETLGEHHVYFLNPDAYDFASGEYDYFVSTLGWAYLDCLKVRLAEIIEALQL